MAFNFSNKPETVKFELIPAGDYEVYVEKAEELPTRTGRKQLNLQLRIRDDIEQVCQRRMVFLKIYQKTPEKLEERDRQVEGYIYDHLFHLLDVTGILESGKDFASMADICRLLAGRELRVTVHHKEFNGRTQEEIDQMKGVHKSKTGVNAPPSYQPPQPPVNPAPATGFDDFEDLPSDDDLPF